MQDDLNKSDSSNNETQIEKDLDQQVDEKSQTNLECIGKLIDNFDYTTSDMIFWEQPPPYSKLSTTIVPIKLYYAKGQIIISKISNLRNFFLISSIIYFIWGVLAFIWTIALTNFLYLPPYFSLWSTSLILNGSINIYVVLSWSLNDISRLKSMFSLTICLNTIGFIVSIAFSNFPPLMLYLNSSNCDNIFAAYLEFVYFLIFIVATIHNVCNVVIVYSINKEKMLKYFPSSV